MHIYLFLLLFVFTTVSCKNIKEEETRQRYGVQNFGNNGDSIGVDGTDGDGLDAGGVDSTGGDGLDAGGSVSDGGAVGGTVSDGGTTTGTNFGLSSDDILLTANGIGSVYSAEANEKLTIAWSASEFRECLVEPLGKSGLSGNDEITMDKAFIVIGATCQTNDGQTKSKTLVVLRREDSTTPTTGGVAEVINLFTPTAVDAGKNFDISWSAFGFDSCEVIPLDQSGLSGTATTMVTTATQISVECLKDEVKTIESKVINVNTIDKPEITVFINGQSGSPEVEKGQDVYISWDVKNLGTEGKCDFSPSAATKVSDNRVKISSIQSAVDVIVSCEGLGGTTSVTKKINVRDPVIPIKPIASSLLVNNVAVIDENIKTLKVRKGSDLSIVWQSVDAESCELRAGSLTVNNINGSENLDNITTETNVILVCRDSSGASVKREVKVELDESINLEIVSFLANGQASVKIIRGQPVSLQWESKGASNCIVSPSDHEGVSNNVKIDSLEESTSFELKCFQGAEQKLAVVTVNVLEPFELNPSAELTVNGSAAPVTINPGDDVVIAWSADLSGTECVLLPNMQVTRSTTAAGLTGNVTMRNITVPFVSTLYCYNKSGFDVSNVNVNVRGFENPANITNADLTINGKKARDQINKGENGLFSWQSQNATKCHFLKDKIDQLNGNVNRTNVTESELGLVYCSGASGSVIDAAYLDTEDYSGGATASLTVNNSEGKITVNYGDTITLRWNSSNAQNCHVQNLGDVDSSGEESIVVSNSTVFRLRCVSSENNNKLQDIVVVNVRPRILPPLDATVSLFELKNNVKTSNEVNAAHNAAITLGWDSTNSSSCQLAFRIGNQVNFTSITSSTQKSATFKTTNNAPDIEYRVTCAGTNGSTATSLLKVLRDCPSHVMFTTITWYAGNQVNPGGSSTLQGADDLCVSAARSRGLCNNRSFKAVLSSGQIEAKNKITINGAVYNNRSTGRQLIANNSSSFWTNSDWPTSAKYSETGQIAPLLFAGAAQDNNVWTATNNLGGSTSLHCTNWTRTTGRGTAGSIAEIDDRFRDGSFQSQDCGKSKHLYCMSQ